MPFDLGDDLGGKLGPAPVWAWIAGGAGLVVAISLIVKKKAGSSSASSTAATPVSAVNPFLFGTGSGAATGPSGGGGGQTAPPPSTSPQTGELGSFQQNLAAGLVGGGQAQGQPAGIGYATDAQSRGVLPESAIPGYPSLRINGITGVVETVYGIPGYDPAGDTRRFLASLGTPAQLPVGDLYGSVGMQTPAAAAAGGYWGANGWVSTPTPWNPQSGQPPAGSLAPGTPYTVGGGQTVPSSGSVQGAPLHYQSYTPGALNPAGVGYELAIPGAQSPAPLSPWRIA